MSEFKVQVQNLSGIMDSTERLESILQQAENSVTSVKRNLRAQIRQRERIDSRLTAIAEQLGTQRQSVGCAVSTGRQVVGFYQETEQNLLKLKFSPQSFDNSAMKSLVDADPSEFDVFLEELSSNYGLDDALKGAGYVGTIYDFIQDIKNGKSWKDFAKTGVDIYQFASGAAMTFSNYKKIGNAVGTKTAMTWWAKSVTGIKPLGRASTAKNPLTRFRNNLTNKTSPFNAQFKSIVGDFAGKNGVGKAVTSWGAVAVNGFVNWTDNKEEQAQSNGKMSDSRVVAETITETVVDTVLTYGSSMVVGAAVTAAFGTVAAPGVLVVAASGLVVAGLNAGVKALTGKTTTEWISDTILDTGKAIGDAAGEIAKSVGSAAKNVGKSVGKWFKKLIS